MQISNCRLNETEVELFGESAICNLLANADPENVMLLGQSIGPFAIEKELGSGAMGTVYLARHESGTKVAIKIMAPGLTSTVALERFKRESDILKQLKHPNIVRLIASGKYQRNPFYAMEYRSDLAEILGSPRHCSGDM